MKDDIAFLQVITRNVKGHLDAMSKQPQIYKDNDGNIQLVQSKVNIDYPKCLKRLENLNAVLEKLDGQLSLKNATTFLP